MHSPNAAAAGGSSTPSSGVLLQTRKRPVDRGVTRVPRKLSRAEGVTNVDPRNMTIGEPVTMLELLYAMILTLFGEDRRERGVLRV